jgi:hypothetical protein
LGYIPPFLGGWPGAGFQFEETKKKGKINKSDEMSIYIENIENIFYLRDL